MARARMQYLSNAEKETINERTLDVLKQTGIARRLRQCGAPIYAPALLGPAADSNLSQDSAGSSSRRGRPQLRSWPHDV